MPQAKTTKKKPASKVGGGGVGTKKSKFNFKIMIPVVVLVAALGGFFVYRSFAATIVIKKITNASGEGGANITLYACKYNERRTLATTSYTVRTKLVSSKTFRNNKSVHSYGSGIYEAASGTGGTIYIGKTLAQKASNSWTSGYYKTYEFPNTRSERAVSWSGGGYSGKTGTLVSRLPGC